MRFIERRIQTRPNWSISPYWGEIFPILKAEFQTTGQVLAVRALRGRLEAAKTPEGVWDRWQRRKAGARGRVLHFKNGVGRVWRGPGDRLTSKAFCFRTRSPAGSKFPSDTIHTASVDNVFYLH